MFDSLITFKFKVISDKEVFHAFAREIAEEFEIISEETRLSEPHLSKLANQGRELLLSNKTASLIEVGHTLIKNRLEYDEEWSFGVSLHFMNTVFTTAGFGARYSSLLLLISSSQSLSYH